MKFVSKCSKLSLFCISELGWKDTDLYILDTKKVKTQWNYTYNQQNALGPSNLLKVDHNPILIDCGWSHPYMESQLTKYNLVNTI